MLTADSVPAPSKLAEALEAGVHQRGASASAAYPPRFDEALASPSLQTALARRQLTQDAARGTGQSAGGGGLARTSGGGSSGASAATGDPLADALAALSPLAALASEEGADSLRIVGGEDDGVTKPSPSGGSPRVGGSAPACSGEQALFARDVRRQNAEVFYRRL